MRSLEERKKLIAEASRAAFEAASPEGLGEAVIGSLETLVDASASVFYRINEQGNFVPLAGSLMREGGYRYSREYYEIDPLQSAMRNENPWVFRTERSPSAWRSFVDSPVYRDLCRFYDVHSYFHVRLVNGEHGTKGMYGIMLSHGEHQPPLTTENELDLIELLPALEAALRRSVRETQRHGSRHALEAALETTRRPTVIMDARGGLVWASKRARRLLGLDASARPLPRALLDAALQLGALVEGKRSTASPRTTVQLVGLEGETVSVELRIARTDTGAPVVIAELDLTYDVAAPELAARFNLTAAQASVLASLAQGFSDRAIAERHAISLATVRSHLTQILSKLGVESRLQAALIAARFGVECRLDREGDDDEVPFAR